MSIMARPPRAKNFSSSKSPTLERKINVVKRVVFWTTVINIVIVILVVVAAYAFLSGK